MKTDRFFLTDQHDWQVVEPGIQRKIIGSTEQLMAVCVKFSKGAIGKAHQHELHDQIGYVLQGAFEVVIANETRILSPGDAFIAPRLTLHGAVALEHDSQVLDLFSPRRDDMLGE
ncbi:cupin domain-containing protein [Cobetia crustatorum]|uniref:Cupin domain-containing protein n=1 Tax=Cobetia crustatorum TaxID=553385 RepID=A0A558HPZ2_9GAMM|nr:cupin domain-containing protein [Cobetia crustatorum]TVU71203.1 cupin domain-containing protein [Cobetia crustatorum]